MNNALYRVSFKAGHDEAVRHMTIDVTEYLSPYWSTERSIIDALDDMGFDFAPLTLIGYRKAPKRRLCGVVTYRLVDIDRAYGGPEEGGWYYDDETLVREYTVPKARQARWRQALEHFAKRRGLSVRLGAFERKPRPVYC